MSTEIANWAPIGVFIYKRPEHARRTILSLLACDGASLSRIHVFADGPKSSADAAAVQATRAVAHELFGDRATFVEHERNRGLANSIVAGTKALCDRYGAAIVVEDDLVLAPYFLRFLNEGLERYRDDPRVMQISGHMFDVPAIRGTREALLLPLTTSWGWATWKRAWDLFDSKATGWRERLANDGEENRFNLDGNYDYSRMLQQQMDGALDSWAIRWWYTVFARHGLTLFPPLTLVVNRGLDASGTHDRLARPARQAELGSAISFDLPAAIAESEETPQVFEAIRVFRRSSAFRRLRALGAIPARRLQSLRGHRTQ
jgi:hypothetical protein